jgi:predicted ArsR family transcriptional regulator
MSTAIEAANSTQQALLRTLLRNKDGLTVQALAQALDVSRNAVRQHLTSLERDGLVTRGRTQPSGGRPEQLYVLTSQGSEQFPRQYSWFAELLLELLEGQPGDADLDEKLAGMGRKVAATLAARLAGAPGSADRIAAVATIMRELGYDAASRTENGEPVIEAHNCVFHKLAEKSAEVCSFDVALLSAASGRPVEHRTCMVRGGDACRFHFLTDAGASRRGDTPMDKKRSA